MSMQLLTGRPAEWGARPALIPRCPGQQGFLGIWCYLGGQLVQQFLGCQDSVRKHWGVGLSRLHSLGAERRRSVLHQVINRWGCSDGCF